MPRSALLAALLLAAATSARAGSPPADTHQWVLASWLNVREQPGKTAKVVANWVTNTRVDVSERRDGWCHARTDDAATGWVACEFLAPQPSTLRRFNEAPRATDTDDVARAFWIAPSFGRFAAAGAGFNASALTAEQAAREAATKTAVRFALPEFEAMKQRVQHDLVPRLEQELTRIDPASWTTLATGSRDITDGDDPTALLRAIEPQRLLPPARASLFRRHADVLVFPDASLDAVVAMQGAPGRVEFRGKPTWVDGPYDEGINSIWDVGSVYLRFAAPAVLQEIGRQGQLGGHLVDGASAVGTDYGHGEGDCNLAPPPADRALPGFSELKDEELLLALYLPKALRPGKVEILSRKQRANLPPSQYTGSQFAPAQRGLLVHEIDLDGDGRADLAVIELLEEDGTVSATHALRWQFINVDGHWWFAGTTLIQECA